VAIGALAGKIAQSASAVAIGNGAGQTGQGLSAVAIGLYAGRTGQGQNSVAIGNSAGGTTGNTGQGNGSVAIGYNAGYGVALGANSVAIGTSATATTATSICLNATGVAVNTPAISSCVITPMRTGETGQNVLYNSVSGEVRYTAATTATATYSGPYLGSAISPNGASLVKFNISLANAGTPSSPWAISGGSTDGQLLTILTFGSNPAFTAVVNFDDPAYDAAGDLLGDIVKLINLTFTVVWNSTTGSWYLVSGTA